MHKQRIHSFDELCPFIREVGLQHQDSWRHKSRKIYDHQFLYCFKGTANVKILDRYYKIKRGDLILIQPNTSHEFWVDEDLLGELYWFHCDFFYYNDKEWHYDFYNDAEKYVTLFGEILKYTEHMRENPVFEDGYMLPEYMRFNNPDEVEYLFRRIYNAYIKQDDYWQISAKIYFLEILRHVIKQTNNKKENGNKKLYVVNQIKAYIARNYYKKLSVGDICRDTGLNSEYASRIFKQLQGEKLVEYLNKYRIAQAKKLFLEMDLNVADIADMVGFNNENYFCSVFKKYEGKTPVKAREDLLELYYSL
ncbi:hypothetical protein SH1V18_17700 [Vallitalea longa]|uniref:HTH araC/xylS-type domain-containing protein n=1 Tax=Vallitalea longa TaxID=2936439 RepID=A0A9W5Y8Q9_9FIRM|nr:AraC family transcriptional regulator [Vallitalea longa]GKX29290.1 hypothetical protein SH1V18_17700 [Vallitalea longa]